MRAFLATSLALACCLAGPATATTVEPLDERALSARSDLIAHVKVTGARSERVGRRVFTFYDLEVLEAWRTKDAQAPTKTVLALPGGMVEVDGRSLGQLVPGMPVLVVGHAYVLCLGDDTGPQGARGLMGLWQGAFAVVDSGRLRPFVHGSAPAALVDEAGLRVRLGSPR